MIWHFMHIVSIGLETICMTNFLYLKQFAWNVKSCFLGKIRKIFQYVVCWKFYPECYALSREWSFFLYPFRTCKLSADDKFITFFFFIPTSPLPPPPPHTHPASTPPPENRIQYFVQMVFIGDNLLAWNVKSCFLGKIGKYFKNVVCWNIYPEC